MNRKKACKIRMLCRAIKGGGLPPELAASYIVAIGRPLARNVADAWRPVIRTDTTIDEWANKLVIYLDRLTGR